MELLTEGSVSANIYPPIYYVNVISGGGSREPDRVHQWTRGLHGQCHHRQNGVSGSDPGAVSGESGRNHQPLSRLTHHARLYASASRPIRSLRAAVSLSRRISHYAGERGQLSSLLPDGDAAKYHYGYQYRKSAAISGKRWI